jgi:O-antigen/teichoic acid export membrane protein
VRQFHAGRLPAAIAWRFTYLVLQGGLSLTLFSVLAHVLPTHEFAAAAVAQGVLVIAQAVGDFGLSQSAVAVLPAQIAEEPAARAVLLRGAATLYGIAALAALVITLVAVLVVPAAAKLPVALIAPAGAVTVLVSGADGLLRSQAEFRRPAVIVTISRLGAFAGVAAAALDKTATATCAGIALGTFVASVPAALVLLKCFRGAQHGRLRELRHAANALGLGEFCIIASGRLDTVLLSAISGTLAGAGFESAWRVYQLAQYVVGGLATAAAPFIANSVGSGSNDHVVSLMRRIGALVLAAGVVLGVGLLLFGGALSRLLFGSLGPAVAHALPPLAVLTPLSFLGFFAMIMLATSPSERWWILPANALGAVVNVVLLLVTARHGQLLDGTLACAVGLAVGSVALLWRLAAYVRSLRVGGLDEPSRDIDLGIEFNLDRSGNA